MRGIIKIAELKIFTISENMVSPLAYPSYGNAHDFVLIIAVVPNLRAHFSNLRISLEFRLDRREEKVCMTEQS